MKIVLISFLLSIKLLSADFITLKEYSKMLYENPRGISCKECHGIDGSEQILGYYIKNGVKTAYKVPNIQNLSFEAFKNSLNQNKNTKSIMPNYSLTPDEVMTLYNYIKQFSKEEK
ncbi:hypothetical protein LNU06_02630 [Campylobacter sp. VicNov18]|uniref:c-type cytochrome n=1 Tax=Campylobacter bilis TaxID=2691918 RepID=UPI00130D9EA6|nr:c-type cytochrome [Campylobacter bilis]MPV63541.1 hypothetical protein [Campylobacter hepaticus]MBM0637041.1 hypothetical protein [Campylobacter bilis]MCC8277802.1 hypothetical protein [Campylobacter bilis]MCC8299411.1 hypothetical protein [Campylobacter bilis]MCC8300711.1 hypothetical protein [Campylobacter bilis]